MSNPEEETYYRWKHDTAVNKMIHMLYLPISNKYNSKFMNDWTIKIIYQL
jgi:hypothetical protein